MAEFEVKKVAPGTGETVFEFTIFKTAKTPAGEDVQVVDRTEKWTLSQLELRKEIVRLQLQDLKEKIDAAIAL